MIARTVSTENPPSLVDFAGEDGVVFSRDRCGLAGRGVALELKADDVDSVLASIDVEDDVRRPGTGPVAMGALPFERTEAGTLVIPAVVLGRSTDGAAWTTTIGTTGPGPAPRLSSARPPDAFTLTSDRPHEDWCRLVERTVAAIEASPSLRKVVLARDVAVEANRDIAVVDVLHRLAALYPSCTLFAVDGFVGASPELLVSRRGIKVASHPLAGTVSRRGDPVADDAAAAALLASAKEREEHGLVVDAVRRTLAPWCTHLDAPDTPSVLALRNVSHLATMVTGELAAPAPSVLALALALHPTPAVGGTPTDEACAWIAEHEQLDRGRYAGPVGWVDARGDGEFVVGIRCAEIDGCQARLIAGNGIVAGSSPEAELAETQLKLQALLAAIVRP